MKRIAIVFLLLSAAALADEKVPAPARPVIVFFGDNLTEGYGVKPSEAYPALIEARIAQRGWHFSLENRSQSGDTSGEALERASRWLDEPIDVLVVALGANDGLQRLSYAQLEKNLRRIVEKAYAANKGARIIILGMRMPQELGLYSRRFNDVYRRVAWEYRTLYLPFLLEDVVDVPSLTLADGIQPNADGHRIMADHVWGVLEPALKKYFPQQAPSP